MGSQSSSTPVHGMEPSSPKTISENTSWNPNQNASTAQDPAATKQRKPNDLVIHTCRSRHGQSGLDWSQTQIRLVGRTIQLRSLDHLCTHNTTVRVPDLIGVLHCHPNQELHGLVKSRSDQSWHMIREKCSCGAEFKTDEPSAIKLIREWRRTHTCKEPEDIPQDRPSLSTSLDMPPSDQRSPELHIGFKPDFDD